MKKILSSIVLLLFLSSIAFAAVPWSKFTYFKNWGGLNDNVSTLEIEDNEATDIQNVTFDTGGSITKRYGFWNITGSNRPYAVAAGASAVTGLYYYKKSNGNKYLVAVANVGGTSQVFYKQYDASNNIPSGAWNRIDTAGLTTGYTDNYLVSFSTAEDQAIITLNGSSQTKPWAWQATGNVYQLTSDTDCPNSTINVYHKNILFTAGDSTHRSRVSFTDLTNGITQCVATDFFELDKNNGQYITGLVSAFGNLYIFENNSIWMLIGSTRDDFALQKMVDNVGTLSNQSISVVNNLIYFVTSQNDVAVYDGNYSVKFISSKIRNTIGSNNFSRASQALGIGFSTYKYKDLDYYVSESIVANNKNNQVLVFDTFRQAWTKFSGMNANAWTIDEDSSGKNRLVFGDYSGNVFFYPNLSSYNDVTNTCDGSNNCTATSPAIYSFYQTKWFRYPEVALGDKYLRMVKTYVYNSNLNSNLSMEVRTDYSSSGNVYVFPYSPSGSLWGVSQWGDGVWVGSGLNVQRQELNNTGTQMFQLKYSNNSASQDMTILGFDMFIEGTDRI